MRTKMIIETEVKQVCFDMDGTLADFYGVENWLESLTNEDTAPYEQATPLYRMATVARLLNNLQRKGYRLVIISWLAKYSSPEYDARVTLAKLKWLSQHLKSVKWDEIHILPYGSPKQEYGGGILFDDEVANRNAWGKLAFPPEMMLEVLKSL